MLIHDSTKSAMDEMAQRFFWMNKKIDRMKSVLNTKFAMPIFSNLVHLQLAHSYPILADDINDIEEMFNYDAEYLQVEGATEDYEDVDTLVGQLYDWTIDTNEQLNNLITLSHNNGDFNAYNLLLEVSKKYSKYVANAILIVDKKSIYGDKLYDMDVQSKEWWVL